MLLKNQRIRYNYNLTQREFDTIKLFSFKKREIASRMCISIGTVNSHVTDILQKLQARTRAQAVIIALKKGIIGLDDLITE